MRQIWRTLSVNEPMLAEALLWSMIIGAGAGIAFAWKRFPALITSVSDWRSVPTIIALIGLTVQAFLFASYVIATRNTPFGERLHSFSRYARIDSYVWFVVLPTSILGKRGNRLVLCFSSLAIEAVWLMLALSV